MRDECVLFVHQDLYINDSEGNDINYSHLDIMTEETSKKAYS